VPQLPDDAAAEPEADRRTRGSRRGIRVGGAIVAALLAALAVVVVSLVLALLVLLIQSLVPPMRDVLPLDRVPIAAAAGAVALLLAVVVLVARDLRARRNARERLRRYAAGNRMEYLAEVPDPEQPGAIFQLGRDRVAEDVIRFRRARPVEVGLHRYTTGGVRAPETHRWWYLAIALERKLPHFVLEARSGAEPGSTSALPIPLDSSQRLSLEGDFDRHFSLLSPAGFERDALYLFTPDVMARLIDQASGLHVEVVDDRLYLYGRRSLTWYAAPATWEWLLSTVDLLDAKLDRWERWRDHDDPGPGSAPIGAPLPQDVAPAGRRLRQRIPLLAVVPLAVMIGTWFVLPFLG
jgi:hypothetical protein